jgi:hypothetical protein
MGSVNVTATPEILPGVFVGAPVGLSATAIATCPGALSYTWHFVQRPVGSNAVLSSPSAPNPSFVPDLGGSYVVSVMAVDAFGNTSPTGMATLVVSNCGSSALTVAITVPATLGTTPPLIAYVSSVDNDPTRCPVRFATTFTYLWHVVSAPGGSVAGLSPVTGPSVNLVGGVTGATYGVSVEVTASNGLGGSGTVSVGPLP